MKKFLFVLIFLSALCMQASASLPSKVSTHGAWMGYIVLSALATNISASIWQSYKEEKVDNLERFIQERKMKLDLLKKIQKDLTSLTWENFTAQNERKFFENTKDKIESLNWRDYLMVKLAWEKLICSRSEDIYLREKNEIEAQVRINIQVLENANEESKKKYQQEVTALTRKKTAAKLTTMGLAATTLALIANKCYRCLYHR